MPVFVATFLTVLAVELTDKTRLIALLLSARYKMPFQLIIGMTLGYVPAIAVAVLGAEAITQVIPASVLRWALAASFLGFGIYLLWHRDDGEDTARTQTRLTRLDRFSPFWIGLVLVAITEFADKSQIATAGLMARYRQGWPVFLGSISAQAVLNILYVGFGHALGQRLPVGIIQRITGAAFVAFGLLVLLSGK